MSAPAIPLPEVPNQKPHVITVSIVEDDDWIRKNMTAQINLHSGFRCSSQHRSAEEALQEIPSIKPDVILMDINLPGMSGIDCLRQLKQLVPDVNVLMLTVYEDSDRIFDSLKAGANGYLLKRTAQTELLQAIEQVQQGCSPMSGLIARKVVEFFKQRGETSSALGTLSPREREILGRLGDGMSYKEIATGLNLSVDTVRMHIRGIYRKLHVHSRGEAVAKLHSQ